jgi:hypothetical protein
MTNSIVKTFLKYSLIILILNQCSSFSSTEELVLKICGLEPLNAESIEISENTIFPVDSNFLPVNLYDIENNVVTTTSWVECRHYVNSGWVYYDIGNKISINNVSFFKASGYLWMILMPMLFYIYWRTVEKN